MKKVATAFALIAFASQAFAMLAMFTGQQQFVQTVTGQTVIQCVYRVNSQTFTRLFPMGTSCPPSLEVQ